VATYPNHVLLNSVIDRLRNLGFRVEYQQKTRRAGIVIRRIGKIHSCEVVIQARGRDDKIPAEAVEAIRRQRGAPPEMGVPNDKFWRDL
jgi:hypothetical protein